MVKNASHTLAYSLIALQEMNLAYKYPIIFWNCACLINDSGGNEVEEEEDEEEVITTETYYNEMEEFTEDDSEDDIEDSYEEEDCDGFPAEVVVMKNGKKKKKMRATNYGKVASAIGKIKSAGVIIAPPDINKSSYTFSPDVDNNTIRFGLSGITRISESMIQAIIASRPYTSLEDFMTRVKNNKLQMVNLIKSGAFDCFGDRIDIMKKYIVSISDLKKRVTLQNMKMLIDFKLIPQEYDMECRVFNFNKYLKKQKLNETYYGMDNIAFGFYNEHFEISNLIPNEETESGFMIKQAAWKKIYDKHMDKVRPYVREHNAELLAAMNNRLVQDMWNKYCLGNISKWEMESISCYIHNHELLNVNQSLYRCSNFFDLYEQPEIDRVIYIKGKQVPLFKIERIMGTVLDRDKAKKTLTLLTTTGVVSVKIFGDAFTNYDRQTSERGADGKKHVLEKSWFSRGNKIIVTGIRREESFYAKKYARTPHHLVELIKEIDGDELIIQPERLAV